MKVRRLALGLAAAAFLAMAAGAACGGGELSLPEYYRELSRTFAESDRRIEEQAAQLQRSGAVLPEDELEIERTRYTGFAVIIGELVDDMRSLKPPPEVEDAHGEYLAGFEERLTLFQELARDVASAASLEEAKAAIEEPGLVDRFVANTERTDAACARLGAIALENLIGDFAC